MSEAKGALAHLRRFILRTRMLMFLPTKIKEAAREALPQLDTIERHLTKFEKERKLFAILAYQGNNMSKAKLASVLGVGLMDVDDEVERLRFVRNEHPGNVQTNGRG